MFDLKVTFHTLSLLKSCSVLFNRNTRLTRFFSTIGQGQEKRMAEAGRRGCLALGRPEEVRRSRRVAQEEARLHRLKQTNLFFVIVREIPYPTLLS